jgi:hypothetical protein
VTVSKIEQLQFGISREWHQGDVNYCILRTPEVLDRAGLEYWGLVIGASVKLFKPDEPVRILYDLSLRGRIIPHYIGTLYQALAGRHGYQAFVLPDELVHRVMVAIRHMRAEYGDNITGRFDERLFTAEADALNWLLNVN